MRGWLFVVLSALLQIGWLIALRQIEGFRRPVPLLLYAFFGFTSAWCLGRALAVLPLSVAYAAWTGISVAGSVAVDVLVAGEIGFARLVCILLIVAGAAGLRVFEPAPRAASGSASHPAQPG